MTSELDKNGLKPIKLYNNNLVSEKQMVVSKGCLKVSLKLWPTKLLLNLPARWFYQISALGFENR